MKYLITGGAGFIGSNLANRLLLNPDNYVTIVDDFSVGKKKYLNFSKNLEIINADVADADIMLPALKGINVVYHLASNSDISVSADNPTIDFLKGTALTQMLLEVMRISGTPRLLFASGSGVYGDAGDTLLSEDYPYKIPVSTYGASKLSSEAMIAAYANMFDIRASILRFANVTGKNQTHGVAYDFIKKLKINPEELNILGNGEQKKSYIYIEDVLDAFQIVENEQNNLFDYFNVSTNDSITVKEIAEEVVAALSLKNVKMNYEEEPIGWNGDVSIVRLSSEKIRSLGWKNKKSSIEAIRLAIKEIIGNINDK